MKLKSTFRNLYPMLTYARFNVAAWQRKEDNHLMLMGRNLNKPSGPSEPDVGSLVVTEFDENGQMISDTQVWHPSDNEFSLEDPRAIVEPDGTIDMGLTAVYKEADSYITYPALVKLPSGWSRKLPEVKVLDKFGAGKNVTPLGNNEYLFRPETEDFNHRLLVFRFDGNEPEKIGEVIMPDNLTWAEWKIGTTVPPIWIKQDTAIFIVHGITRTDGLLHYSIGLGKLVRSSEGLKAVVDPEPILTPDDFLTDGGLPLVAELRPDERKVVYACGGLIDSLDSNKLKIYLNVGDKTTFEVVFEIKEILGALETV